MAKIYTHTDIDAAFQAVYRAKEALASAQAELHRIENAVDEAARERLWNAHSDLGLTRHDVSVG